MAVEWDKETEQEFITEIKVDMFNHQGALANLTAAINTTTSNIQSLNTEEKDGRVYSAFYSPDRTRSCAPGKYHAQNPCYAGRDKSHP